MTESPAERRYRERMALNDVLARAEERTAQALREATEQPVDGPATGRCPVCHREGLRLRKNGTVWNHGNKISSLNDPRYGQNCAGAGQNPEETP